MSKAKTVSSEVGQAGLEYLDALYGYAMILTHDPTEAEDLVQETYLRAVRSCGRLQPNSNVKGWLFTIMRNLWLNRLRHDRSGPRFVELEPEDDNPARGLGSEGDNPHLIFMSKVRSEQVHAAIESLPRVYREVVVLRDIEGFSYQQIANILECPAGTLMSRLNRARERLRLLLAHWRVEVVAK